MKKWQKFLLILLTVPYFLGIVLALWPKLVRTLAHQLSDVDATNLRVSYFLGLLALTLLLFLIFLCYPLEKSEFILQKEKGQLSLTNQGLSSFICAQLAHEGLENIEVKIKHYERRQKIKITAATLYKAEKLKELPRIKAELDQTLLALILPAQPAKLKTSLRLNQLEPSHKSVRVS